MEINTPSQYVDKIISLAYKILKIDYKALGKTYDNDTNLTEDDINNKDYYYIWLDNYSVENNTRKQTVIKCNVTAKQLVDIIQTRPDYEQLVNSTYELYKDDPDVSESGIEIIDSVNEFLNKLYENDLLNLISIDASQNMSSSSLDDESINISDNYVTTSNDESTNTISSNNNNGSMGGGTGGVGAIFESGDVTDSDYGKEIEGVDYEYSYRIKNSFRIVKINNYYYAIPFDDKSSARYFIKLNEVAMIAVECFKNLTNRQTIIDKLSKSFPDEPYEDIFAAATYVYNQMWIGFDVGSHYETSKDTEGDN